MSTLKVILLGASAVLIVLGLIGYILARNGLKDNGENKKLKKRKWVFIAVLLLGIWLLIGTLISAFYLGYAGLEVEFALFPERVKIFGISIAKTSLVGCGIVVITLILSLIFRFVVFPRFSPDNPKGFQNVMELGVEAMEKFAHDNLGDYADTLAPYMFSLAVFMIFSAASELLGFRPPTADLLVTLSMGLITFALINYFGIKKKGFGGRVKSLAQPTPVVFPMKILSDIAVPVSLACRLFGNMLGGMIVMDLLKSVLGGYGSGLPAVMGLYFNLFHPVIQAYIFIILSMTFINEAIE